ncbi:MAG: hypothetical protein B7Z78_03310 [Rhodospirillales bacterium 20-60-12]|nr:MAG: hypothetical protein B7Z78_03310 [Rhodospirillales bacterium 20-60-12]HQT68205.1 hypothetical protein [Acetobacteraceae bacterium]
MQPPEKFATGICASLQSGYALIAQGQDAGRLPTNPAEPPLIESETVFKQTQPTLLARHPDFKFDQSLVFGMFGMIGYLILHLNIDTVFTAVCAKHVAFYRRLGFYEIAKPRGYPGLNNIKGGLMACFR